jgi:hypothetical protein
VAASEIRQSLRFAPKVQSTVCVLPLKEHRRLDSEPSPADQTIEREHLLIAGLSVHVAPVDEIARLAEWMCDSRTLMRGARESVRAAAMDDQFPCECSVRPCVDFDLQASDSKMMREHSDSSDRCLATKNWTETGLAVHALLPVDVDPTELTRQFDETATHQYGSSAARYHKTDPTTDRERSWSPVSRAPAEDESASTEFSGQHFQIESAVRPHSVQTDTHPSAAADSFDDHGALQTLRQAVDS